MSGQRGQSHRTEQPDVGTERRGARHPAACRGLPQRSRRGVASSRSPRHPSLPLAVAGAGEHRTHKAMISADHHEHAGLRR